MSSRCKCGSSEAFCGRQRMLYRGVLEKAGNRGHDTQIGHSVNTGTPYNSHILGLLKKHKYDESSGTHNRDSQQGMVRG